MPVKVKLEKRKFKGRFPDLGGFWFSTANMWKEREKFFRDFKEKIGIDINSLANRGYGPFVSQEKFEEAKRLCEELGLSYSLFPVNSCSLSYSPFNRDEENRCRRNNAQGLAFEICGADMHDGGVSGRLNLPITSFYYVSFIPDFETISEEILKQIEIASADITSLEELTTKINDLRNYLDKFSYVGFSDLWEHPSRYRLCQSCYENPKRIDDVRGKYSKDLRKELEGLNLTPEFLDAQYGSEMKVEEIGVK